MNKTQILFLVVLMASACSTAIFEKEGKAREPNSIEEAREDAWAKIDKVACRKKGGEVRSEGMLGMPMCVVPYEDAGEICTDSTDCRGDCRADDRITNYNAPPGAAKGVCQFDNSPFGCYATITNGSVDPAICVD